MGLIAKVLSYFTTVKRTTRIPQVKALVTGTDTKNLELYSDAGNDSPPLANDYTVAVKTTQTGVFVAVGCLDSSNTPVAEAGEKRIYSRNASGVTQAEIHLKKDGNLTITNSAGSFSMSPTGTVTINGLTIDASGNLSTTGTVKGIGVTDLTTNVTLSTHVHTGAGQPPTPGT